MSDYYFLNEDHTYIPCDLITWSNQLEKGNKVANGIINDKHVSTVWLGIDHNFLGSSPLLFETMIFDKDGKGVYLDRYTTWDEAIEGHKKALQWVMDGCKDK